MISSNQISREGNVTKSKTAEEFAPATRPGATYIECAKDEDDNNNNHSNTSKFQQEQHDSTSKRPMVIPATQPGVKRVIYAMKDESGIRKVLHPQKMNTQEGVQRMFQEDSSIRCNLELNDDAAESKSKIEFWRNPENVVASTSDRIIHPLLLKVSMDNERELSKGVEDKMRKREMPMRECRPGATFVMSNPPTLDREIYPKSAASSVGPQPHIRLIRCAHDSDASKKRNQTIQAKDPSMINSRPIKRYIIRGSDGNAGSSQGQKLANIYSSSSVDKKNEKEVAAAAPTAFWRPASAQENDGDEKKQKKGSQDKLKSVHQEQHHRMMGGVGVPNAFPVSAEVVEDEFETMQMMDDLQRQIDARNVEMQMKQKEMKAMAAELDRVRNMISPLQECPIVEAEALTDSDSERSTADQQRPRPQTSRQRHIESSYRRGRLTQAEAVVYQDIMDTECSCVIS